VSPQGVRQGSGQKFQLLPEKGVPHRRPGGGLVGGRDSVLHPVEQFFCLPGRDGLHIGTAPGEGQLLGGQRSRKTHPQHPVPVGDGLQNGRRKGEIVGVLGQGEGREKCFPAAGRAGGAVAVGEGGFVRPEGYGQLSGQSQRVDTVLAGIQVEQQKAGCCRLGGSDADQQTQAVLFLRLTDGDAALRPGGQSCPQRAAGEQHGAAH